MRVTIVAIILAITTTLSLRAQGQFEINKPFSEVVLRGAIYAEFIPSNEPKVVVTVNGTTTSRVEWSVRSNRLHITLRVGVTELSKEISADVKIYYDELSYIGVEGASLTNSIPIQSQLLKVETLGGVNDFSLAVDTQTLEVVTSGKCKARFTGKSGMVNVMTMVGAMVDCAECEAGFVAAEARQRSEIVVRTTGGMNAVAKTGSNIFYIGTPSMSADVKYGSGVMHISQRKR